MCLFSKVKENSRFIYVFILSYLLIDVHFGQNSTALVTISLLFLTVVLLTLQLKPRKHSQMTDNFVQSSNKLRVNT